MHEWNELCDHNIAARSYSKRLCPREALFQDLLALPRPPEGPAQWPLSQQNGYMALLFGYFGGPDIPRIHSLDSPVLQAFAMGVSVFKVSNIDPQ